MARVFSGIQPTGEMHLGNYLGAVRQWVADQDEYDAIYCVVDLHAMTLPYDRPSYADRTRTRPLLLAAGLDPERCLLFVQSHVHAHTELTWVLNCVATFGELRRMTQFKEKGQGQESRERRAVRLPGAHGGRHPRLRHRPGSVGDDQRQHLELARDIAIRFNHRFGDTLVVPKAAIPPVGAGSWTCRTPPRRCRSRPIRRRARSRCSTIRRRSPSASRAR
jgi:tryptophanyl-tRNA synthetase